MKTFIHDTLQHLLNTLEEGFDTNELAYLSAQGKNELQIRDKIAWRLHNIIESEFGANSKYVVRREWTPNGRDNRVDLAVLELDDSTNQVKRAIALIEFKAQSIVKHEKWYLDQFKHDVDKMKSMRSNIACCHDADLYFVFLVTGQERKAETYLPALGFAIYLTRNVKYHEDPDCLTAMKELWKEFENVINESINIHNPNAIYIGEAFGSKLYVSPLLIGPIK